MVIANPISPVLVSKLIEGKVMNIKQAMDMVDERGDCYVAHGFIRRASWSIDLIKSTGEPVGYGWEDYSMDDERIGTIRLKYDDDHGFDNITVSLDDMFFTDTISVVYKDGEVTFDYFDLCSFSKVDVCGRKTSDVYKSYIPDYITFDDLLALDWEVYRGVEYDVDIGSILKRTLVKD